MNAMRRFRFILLHPSLSHCHSDGMCLIVRAQPFEDVNHLVLDSLRRDG